MTFDSRETSLEGSQPVLLIHFFRTGKDWYYTNSDQDITFDSQVYTAIPISMTSVVQSGDAKAENLDFTLPASATICVYLDTFFPTETIGVRVRKVHMDETVATGEYTSPVDPLDAPVIWVGEHINTKRPSVSQRVLTCNTLSLSMNRGGLRLSWSRQCPHFLYMRGCFVNKADFAVTLTSFVVVDGVTVNAVEFGTMDANYFDGGFIEWESETGVVERTGIETQVGGTATIFGTTVGMATGASFIAYPGCNRTAETCNEKFDNLLNYGGINHMQGTSPFDGKPIF